MPPPGDSPHLLVADVGGTNSRFAIARADGNRISLRQVARFTNAGVADFAAQLARYAESIEQALPENACIAVAGPVSAGCAALTNGSWRFDAGSLRSGFSFTRVSLINDFTALASSVCCLETRHLHRIKAGQPVPDAPLCVIGPGTGLGVACVVSPGPQQTVIPTEGGHVDLAAVTAQEWSLKQSIGCQLGERVSAEHALSGEGLRRIDAFLRNTGELRAAPSITDEALGDPASDGYRAVSLFLSLLARFAGNTALSQGARGGVFIGGGILPRLLPILDPDRFSRDFSDKGAMAAYCGALPIHLITDTDAALRGAAAAFEQARERVVSS